MKFEFDRTEPVVGTAIYTKDGQLGFLRLVPASEIVPIWYKFTDGGWAVSRLGGPLEASYQEFLKEEV